MSEHTAESGAPRMPRVNYTTIPSQREYARAHADLNALQVAAYRDGYQTGLAVRRDQVLLWADDQMQALPESRTPVADGKAEVLTELRNLLHGSATSPEGTED